MHYFDSSSEALQVFELQVRILVLRVQSFGVMINDKTILVSGAGIWRATFAFWLSVAGFGPTVIAHATKLLVRSAGALVHGVVDHFDLVNPLPLPA